jgi:hypothetical protein
MQVEKVLAFFERNSKLLFRSWHFSVTREDTGGNSWN